MAITRLSQTKDYAYAEPEEPNTPPVRSKTQKYTRKTTRKDHHPETAITIKVAPIDCP